MVKLYNSGNVLVIFVKTNINKNSFDLTDFCKTLNDLIKAGDYDIEELFASLFRSLIYSTDIEKIENIINNIILNNDNIAKEAYSLLFRMYYYFEIQDKLDITLKKYKTLYSEDINSQCGDLYLSYLKTKDYTNEDFKSSMDLLINSIIKNSED